MKRLLGALALVGTVLAGQAAPAVAATTGSQSIILVIRDDVATAYATGPISGVGTFVEHPENPDLVTFVFEDGSVTFEAPSDEEDESFNELACVGRFTFSGDYTIVEGTGAYEGATGEGEFDGRGLFVGAHTDEGCSEEGGSFFLFVRVTGTTTLP
ncbi:MAG: hypothetical protein ACLGI2_03370 [Acidimicrobiia bacterium]